jgi:hypothetical protein
MGNSAPSNSGINNGVGPVPGASLASNPAISTAGFPQPPPLTRGSMQVNPASSFGMGGSGGGMFGTTPNVNPQVTTLSGISPNQLIPPNTPPAPAAQAPSPPGIGPLGAVQYEFAKALGFPETGQGGSGSMTVQQWLDSLSPANQQQAEAGDTVLPINPANL